MNNAIQDNCLVITHAAPPEWELKTSQDLAQYLNAGFVVRVDGRDYMVCEPAHVISHLVVCPYVEGQEWWQSPIGTRSFLPWKGPNGIREIHLY